VLSIGTSFVNLSSSERFCEEDMMIEGRMWEARKPLDIVNRMRYYNKD
jgi:hypothetical protein